MSRKIQVSKTYHLEDYEGGDILHVAAWPEYGDGMVKIWTDTIDPKGFHVGDLLHILNELDKELKGE